MSNIRAHEPKGQKQEYFTLMTKITALNSNSGMTDLSNTSDDQYQGTLPQYQSIQP